MIEIVIWAQKAASHFHFFVIENAEILGDRYHKMVPLPIIQTRALAAPAISAPAISDTDTQPIDTFTSRRVTSVNGITTQTIGHKLARIQHPSYEIT